MSHTPHLVFHRCHEISLLSPVDGVGIWPRAAQEVPLGGRAVLQARQEGCGALPGQWPRTVPLPGVEGLVTSPHTGHCSREPWASPGGHHQPAPLAAQGADSRSDSSAGARVEAAESREGGKEGSPCSYPGAGGTGRDLIKVDCRQHSDGCWPSSRCKSLQKPHTRGPPGPPSFPANPHSQHLPGAHSTGTAFKLCKGQIRELVQAH